MKKILIGIIFIGFFFLTKAQDSTEITVYGGFVGMGSIQDTGGTSEFTNLRVGTKVTTKEQKGFSIIGWISYDPGNTGLVLFEGKVKKAWKNSGIIVGYQATPSTLIRPFPLTVDGQFEFTAENLPPGGALGVIVYHKGLKFGVFSRNGKPEYNISCETGAIQTAIWASENNNWGGTVKLDLPRVYAMGTVTGKGQQALALAFQPIKKLEWKVAWDIALKEGRVSNNFVGLQRSFPVKHLTDARFGVGHDFIGRYTGIFFLAGFNHKEKI